MHRFTLEPYNGRDSRYTCPACHHQRYTFKRYIDTETGQQLADHVGRCDRTDTCGYHYPPREYFAAEPGALLLIGNNTLNQQKPSKAFDTMPRWYADDTARAYHQNNFVKFLSKCFGENTAVCLAELYKIGTSKHWPGATIFWQIDQNDKLRTGKIMLYNATDGHRVKQPYNHITWIHVLMVRDTRKGVPSNTIHEPGYRLQQCFFGEHLLSTDPFKTVAIVESEKTAMIASFFNPRYIWLSAGSLEGLSRDKCSVLNGRRVILYPDVNGYDKWRLKAREMNLRLPEAKFTVDDTLERLATADERTRGIDIADRWIDQLTQPL